VYMEYSRIFCTLFLCVGSYDVFISVYRFYYIFINKGSESLDGFGKIGKLWII